MMKSKKNHYYFFLVFFLVFIFLVLRTVGLYPICFSDEYQYSLLARIQPLSEAHLPNYLYLKIFHWTNFFGDGFLMAARIFNILFFCCATFFLYHIAQNYTSKNQALWISLLALLAPINTYTAFFMPESLYYFLFVLGMWSLLRIDPDSPSRAWLLPGAVLGLNALVKPHAQLLIPAVLLYMLLSIGPLFPSVQARLVSAAKACALFLIGVYAVKFGLGYLLAGKTGVNMAGQTYGSIHYEFLHNLPNFLHSLWGHICGLLIVFGFPLFIAAYKLLSRPSYTRGRSYQERTCLIVCLMVCLMVIQVAFFTANIAGQGPYEHPNLYTFATTAFFLFFYCL